MWTVYRVICQTPNTTYIGISQNPRHRLQQHQKGQGSAWTKTYGYKEAQIVCMSATEAAAKQAERLAVLRDRLQGRSVGGSGWTGT